MTTLSLSSLTRDVATSSDEQASSAANPWLLIALAIGIWAAVRTIFWVGFAGADDQFYAYYAYWFHRIPVNHMEARTVAVLAIRASYWLFGPTEFAAAAPGLLGSLGLLLGAAWFVGWPGKLNWVTNSTVLMAAVLPIDVTFSTYPGASSISAGCLMFGSFAFIKGDRWLATLGAVLLGLGFMAHEMAFFYVAILCLTALALDWRRYWQRVLLCVIVSGLLFVAEAEMFRQQTGNFWFRMALGDTYTQGEGILLDGRSDSVTGFFLIPLKILLLCKEFGFDLVLLFVSGAIAWRRLDTQQRVVLASCFLFWFWLGYGTVVPWTYRPPTRGMHYYIPLAIGIVSMLPTVLSIALAKWQRLAKVIIALVLATHLASLLLGGSWGQRVDVSRSLLAYVEAHPDEVFVTDVRTLNEMYLRNGYRMPPNVVALESQRLVGDLLVNKEPKGRKNFRFRLPDHIDGILVNHEPSESPLEPEFTAFLKLHQGESRYYVPKKYRMAFVPLVGVLGPREFMIRHHGADVCAFVPSIPESAPSEMN